jgi:hypothetical protein
MFSGAVSAVRNVFASNDAAVCEAIKKNFNSYRATTAVTRHLTTGQRQLNILRAESTGLV